VGGSNPIRGKLKKKKAGLEGTARVTGSLEKGEWVCGSNKGERDMKSGEKKGGAC